MSGGTIPEDVRRFVEEHIDSVEMMEVLLLLRRRRDDAWSADDVANELRLNAASVARRLAQLNDIGLASKKDGDQSHFVYDPKSPALEDVCNGLESAYRSYRHKLYELIFSPHRGARSFANSFRVKRGMGEDDS